MESLRRSLEAEAAAGHAAAATARDEARALATEVAALRAATEKLENRLAAAAGVSDNAKR